MVPLQVHTEGTMGNELNHGKRTEPWKHRLLVSLEHCGLCWNRWGQKALASAQMLHPYGLPVPHFGKTRLVVQKLPRLLDRILGRLLDIMANTVRPKGCEKFILKGGIPKKQLLRL